MPPCQQVVEEGIAGKDAVLIVLQLSGMLVAPFAHEIFPRQNFPRLAVTRQHPYCLAPRQPALVNLKGDVAARRRASAARHRQSAGSIARHAARCASLPIMRTGMVNGL
jgi:hypothetical protein